MTGRDRRKVYDTSTDPSLGRVRRKIVSTLGLLIVLFNLIAGIALSSSASAANAPFLDEIFGDHIVICTGAGMIVLDADGHPMSQNGAVEPMCAFCLPLMQGRADAPVVVAVLEAPLPFVAETVVVETVATTPVVRVTTSALPRGPPRV